MTSRQDWPKPDLLQQHHHIIGPCSGWNGQQQGQ